jgi:hypothetical protein
MCSVTNRRPRTCKLMQISGARSVRGESARMKKWKWPPSAAVFVLVVLAGHVTDATTGQPLSGVTITVGSHRAVTDSRGSYRIPNLAAGRYSLSASSNDVPAQQRAIVIRQTATTTKFDLILCSTTLDYNCAGAGPG